MTGTPPFPDHNVETDTGTPPWVKVFGVIAVIVVLLFVIMLLTGGGGGHGPGRHSGSGLGGQPAPAGITGHGAR
ncbi:MAG: hypothetical protein ACRDV9_06645 [Acidimicrobiia bacterium]